MGRDAQRTACSTLPNSDAECPTIFFDAFGAAVIAELERKGIKINGLGLGVGGDSRSDSINGWHASIGVMNWAQVDVAIAIVAELLDRWGIASSFGVSVRGIDCAILL